MRIWFFAAAGFLFIAAIEAAWGQGTAPLTRNTRDPFPRFLIRPSHPMAELAGVFELTRKANSGDPIAQHDLGLCYLEGVGTVPDTVKAAQWIERAAAKGHAVANFNMAVCYSNAWGVPWDPFKAYTAIRFAAEAGMKDAQYFLSRLLVENLVVPRDLKQAYYWVKLSADSGYAPAKEVQAEFLRRGWVSDSTAAEQMVESANRNPGSPSLVFLDFSRDTVARPEPAALVREALTTSGAVKTVARADSQSRHHAGGQSGNPAAADTVVDPAKARSIAVAADLGSPEALVLTGLWYETGQGARQDATMAAAYYLRAMRLDSPRAPRLLYDLIHRPGFFTELKRSVDAGEPAAEFVWSQLAAVGFDQSITSEQAWGLLTRSARRGHIPALIAAGYHAVTGMWTKKDAGLALSYWSDAERLGSGEARLRILMTKLFNKQDPLQPDLVAFLDQQSGSGAILAQLLLGYIYEYGVRVPKSSLLAAQHYRQAASRGSTAALAGLHRLYDAMRPSSGEFRVSY